MRNRLQLFKGGKTIAQNIFREAAQLSCLELPAIPKCFKCQALPQDTFVRVTSFSPHHNYVRWGVIISILKMKKKPQTGI